MVMVIKIAIHYTNLPITQGSRHSFCNMRGLSIDMHDRFGWKDWEIRHGRLYYNQLSYRYYWDPVRLVVPLYGVKDPGIIFQDLSDKVSGIEEARELELVDNNREHKVLALSALKHNSA